MTSIWGFLLCTLAASVTAALLLAVKRLLEDKLPPSWQYGVWGVLLLRLALPFGLDGSSGRQVLLPLPEWVETLKTLCEQHLDSAYDSPFALTRVIAPVGWLPGPPRSVTDWLFVLYLAGAALALGRYAWGYFRLRRLLRRALPPTARQAGQLERVCRQYGFAVPRAVRVPGLPTAFVCGAARPVLALPDTEVDDKVLLHELLHLKYHDSAQSLVWCFFRAVHWCNPFLQFCFDRIGSDGEALCDQRVLERLRGEQRRDYGRILLSMANEPYARAPGTSSLSSGGAEIRRRIQALVRFKHYPKGMALAAVCTAAMLASPLVLGTPAQAADLSTASLAPDGSVHSARLLAQTRVNHCTTLAGALDTYAKALLNGNRAYYLMVSPPERHQQLVQALQAGQPPQAEQEVSALRRLFAARPTSWDQGFSVWDLAKQSDGSYTGWLVFTWAGFRTEAPDAVWESWAGVPCGMTSEDGAAGVSAACFLPIRARQSGGGWYVEAAGESRTAYTTDYLDYASNRLALTYLPPLAVYTAQSEQGKAEARLHTAAAIRQSSATDPNFFFGSRSAFDLTRADPGAAFSQITPRAEIVYTENTPADPAAVFHAGLYIQIHEQAVSAPDRTDNSRTITGDGGGSSTEGYDWISHTYSPGAAQIAPDGTGSAWVSAEPEDGDVSGYLWGGSITDTIYLASALDSASLPDLPYGFTVQFYRNHTQQDVLLLTQEG